MYCLILPDDMVTISSLIKLSFTISVLAETKVPNACSIAERKAMEVAFSFELAVPLTINLTSSICANADIAIKKVLIIRDIFFMLRYLI